MIMLREELRDTRVLIIGLGESGLAMARWCASEGAQIRVTDTRTHPPGLDELRTALPDAEICCGQIDAALLDDIQLIAISPGLSPLQTPQKELLAVAQERGIKVVGEIEMFAQKLAALKAESGYAPRVLAITGTNGKTTVTRLTGQLCERAGFKTRVAGNVSPAALDALTSALQQKDLPAVWVLELSSFQLASTESLAPDAATVLNISQDHLDWHGDMAAYAAAKSRIFADHTVRVLNRDDAGVMALAGDGAVLSSFGLDAPQVVGQFGVQQEGGMRWLAVREGLDEDEPRTVSRQNKQKKMALTAEPEPGLLKRLMPVEALQIRGDHNVANALAALALCRAIDLPMAPLLHALRDYPGEPHRSELVMTLDDIDFIDDSKGTNVGATVAALNGLGNALSSGLKASGKIVLIAGGDGKGQDFTPLVQPVARHVRAVVLIGRDAPTLRHTLAASSKPITDCADLELAVHTAAAMALPGDVVLLSPACASLDMFRNYEHRADVFVNAVRELAMEAGQPC